MKKLIYLLLLAVSWPSFAARQFDVEVILFKRNINPEQVNESWPEQLKQVDMQGALSLEDTAALKAKGVTILPSSQYALNTQYNKLKKHAGFTPLAHIAWRQGDENQANAPKLFITAGRDFSEQFLPDGRSKKDVVQPTNAGSIGSDTNNDGITITTDNSIPLRSDSNNDVADIANEANSDPLYQLNGMLQVYVQHYLFLDANLDLREPSRREVIMTKPLLESIVNEQNAMNVDTDTATENGIDVNSNVQIGHLQEVKKNIKVEEFLKPYRLSQQRRMRSGEIHYLDNPLLGVIIQVRRVGS
ncbi:MAG: peptidoglycan binding protein CsiV [Photobacterium frigidiphilum]|uniref:peptidoglycan binding protein CsiV n=1 Tax=Photobacterium frigidiphilum TaxID=264736 RepID=UPI003001347A